MREEATLRILDVYDRPVGVPVDLEDGELVLLRLWGGTNSGEIVAKIRVHRHMNGSTTLEVVESRR